MLEHERRTLVEQLRLKKFHLSERLRIRRETDRLDRQLRSIRSNHTHRAAELASLLKGHATRAAVQQLASQLRHPAAHAHHAAAGRAAGKVEVHHHHKKVEINMPHPPESRSYSQTFRQISYAAAEAL